MYSVDSLGFTSAADAPLGSILLQRVGSHGSVALRTSFFDGTKEVPALFQFSGGREPFQLSPLPHVSYIWISIGDRWQLEVDPSSSYSTRQSNPAPGDAFAWNGKTGVVGEGSYDQLFISGDGENIDCADAAWDGYTGFRRWRIVHWPQRGFEPVLVFQHSRADPQPNG